MLASSELAGCSLTPEQPFQMGMEPEPVGAMLLVSLLTSSQHEALASPRTCPADHVLTQL